MNSRYLAIFFCIFICLFAFFDINFHGPDEPIYFAYTASIVNDGDLNAIDQTMYSLTNFVSKTFNLPDFHDHGGVTLWAPFYAYAKIAHTIIQSLNFGCSNIDSFDRVAKCVMSFSTIVFAFFVMLLTWLFCARFFSRELSMFAMLTIFFGTPFFFYVLLEPGNNHIISALFTIISIWCCSYTVSMRKNLFWFLFGLFFSVAVSVRNDSWLQLTYILPAIFIFTETKKTAWVKVMFFFSGIFCFMTLRAVNAYLKYGTLHMEEIFYLSSFLRYKSTYGFNGLFNAFRGFFYTSPVLYACMVGFVLVAIDLIKNVQAKNCGRKIQDLLFFILSLYLLFKLLLLGRIFSPGGDTLSGRLIIAEFPILVLLCARAISQLWGKRVYRVGCSLALVLFIFWNFIVISEFMVGLDWVYIMGVPQMIWRMGVIQYLLDALFQVRDLGIKLKFCFPLVLFIAAAGWYLLRFKNLRHLWIGQDNNLDVNLRFKWFSLFTIYLCLAYFIITLLNVQNNGINAQRLKSQGFFKDAEVIEISPVALSIHEEEEHLTSLYKFTAYYGLKNDLAAIQKIKARREEIFGSRVRFRLDRLSLRPYYNLGSAYQIRGKYNKALVCFRKAIALDPNDFEAYISLGDIYTAMHDYDNAIKHFWKALTLRPDLVKLYEVLGNSYRAIDKIEEAVACWQKTIQLDPTAIGVYYDIGNTYADLGDYSKALESFQQAVKLRPTYIEAYMSIGNTYADLGDIANVWKQINKLEELSRQDLAGRLKERIENR